MFLLKTRLSSSTHRAPILLHLTSIKLASSLSPIFLLAFYTIRNAIQSTITRLRYHRNVTSPTLAALEIQAMFSSGKGVFLSSMFSCSEEFRVRLRGGRERKESERKGDTEKKKIEKRRPTKVKEEGRRMEHEQDREKEALSHRRVVWVGHGSFSTSE